MRWTALVFLALGVGMTQVSPAGATLPTSGSLSDLSGLRSVLNAPGELHLVVPQITPWALRLREWRTAGPTIFYIPQSEARKYCGSTLPIRVLPGSVKEPVGFIVGQGGTFEGIALRGLGLIYDPGWAENDRIALWMGLSGPRAGRAWVEGSWTGSLSARVEFQVTERYLGDPQSSSYLFNHVWNGAVQDVRVQGYDAYRLYGGQTLPLVEPGGTVRGECTLRSVTTTVEVGVDTARTSQYTGALGNNYTFSFDPGTGVETFRSVEYAATCGPFGCGWRGYYIYDLQGRYRGSGSGTQCGWNWCTEASIYPRLFETRKTQEEVTARIRPWLERTVWQPQGTFPVEPGGIVRVNGEVYGIPGLEGYGRRPQEVGIWWIRGEPFVSNLAMATGLMGGQVYRGLVMSLQEYCTNIR